MSGSVMCVVVAVVFFLVALIGVLGGSMAAGTVQALTLAGLAAFALGHLPWMR